MVNLYQGNLKVLGLLVPSKVAEKKGFTATFNVGSKLSVGVLMWWRRTISLTSRVCPCYQCMFTCFNYQQVPSQDDALT